MRKEKVEMTTNIAAILPDNSPVLQGNTWIVEE